ncbi:PucR family transcriptional regulator [Leucobacter chinensis]|uniref:PucR family transcriptional regulator n=1 Tax=Leucobacter chinensis TaxID=2851010 RepID=UPI001C244974|nr:helix-turn-helix domain-containing protein [Leucobacter chinensis]
MSVLKPIILRADGKEAGLALLTVEERLGSDVMKVELPPGAQSPLVRSLDLYDASTSAQSSDQGGGGMLLCLVSAEAMREREVQRALDFAVASECAAVVTKLSDERARSEIEAKILDAGLASVALHPDVGWREFDGLLTTTLGEHAQSLTLAPSVGDKLFALANTVARVFGGSVAIEDHQRSILAHSSVSGQAIDELRTTGILFRRAGDAPVNEDRYRRVFEAEGPVRFIRYGDYLPRVAIAVRAGTIPLGSIWALDPQADAEVEGAALAEAKAQVLEQAATMAAGTLLEAWKATNRSTSRRESALRRVLIAAAQQGDREALDPTGEAAGVILVAEVAAGPRSAGRIAEARGVFARHLAMYIPNVVVSAEANEIIALCPTERVDEVRGWALEALADLSADTASGLRVGVSDPHTITTRLPFAVNEARDVAKHSRAVAEPVGTVAGVRTQLFLAACRAQLELDDRLMLPEVRELLDAGEGRQQLVETFIEWLAAAGNVGRAAEQLRVHEQTVRYRLRRLRELLPIEDADPDYLLALWAQLRSGR